uniref:Aminotransferase-like plant mobile domain-containing protein n=1 Tax=Oryza barthii TaxID=65489 RepID=A0A0D3FK46_9ORYZ
MATICENIPNPQPHAAGAKRNRGLGTQDRCPERWRTLEKRNRNGPAHWPCGTAVVCGTNQAKFGGSAKILGTVKTNKWIGGGSGRAVARSGSAGPWRSRTPGVWRTIGPTRYSVETSMHGTVHDRCLPAVQVWANVQVRSAYEYFTEVFDLLKEDNVQWCPYTDEETQRRAPTGLNTLCLRDSSYWLTKKMLLYDIAVEAYSPQRVMRQFGLYQEVPVPLGETVPPKIHL